MNTSYCGIIKSTCGLRMHFTFDQANWYTIEYADGNYICSGFTTVDPASVFAILETEWASGTTNHKFSIVRVVGNAATRATLRNLL